MYACSATGGQTHTIVLGARGAQRRERSIDIMTRASARMRACTIMIMCALHTVLLLQPATAQELCRYANDGECDEPAYCNYGTDSTDCGGAAPGPGCAYILRLQKGPAACRPHNSSSPTCSCGNLG